MARRTIILLAILLLAAALWLLWRAVNTTGEDVSFESRSEHIMATPITVMAPKSEIDEAARIVFDVFRDVDAMMSEWKPGSHLTAVNEAAGVIPVEVPDELRAVLQRGIEIGDLTGGAFDITWAALWDVWNFKAEHPALPEAAELDRRSDLVDYRAIAIDDDSGTVYLPRKGMLIGLGGIAKGTALNRAARVLEARGTRDFLISAGGQVLVRGRRGDRAWRVGIRDPRGGPAHYFTHLELTDAGTATSGDYERFFILDGVRYHHILDPRTGMPTRGLRSVTIVSQDAELADALSTAIMVLGLERGMTLIEELDDAEAILIDDDGVTHTSAGLTGALIPDHS